MGKITKKDKTILGLQEEVERLRGELSSTRHAHARMAKSVKKALGYKNWPKFSGPFQDAVGKLVEQELTTKNEEIARLRAWFECAPTYVTTGKYDIANLSHNALEGKEARE